MVKYFRHYEDSAIRRLITRAEGRSDLGFQPELAVQKSEYKNKLFYKSQFNGMENIGDFSESDMLPKKRPRPSYKRKIIWNVKGNIERISNKIRKIEVAPNKIIAVKISETDEQEDDEIT